MKIFYRILALSAMIFVCSNSFAQVVTSFNADKFHFALSEEKKPQIIDVRTPAEFKTEHLKGAINIDIKSPDFQRKVLKKLKKDKIVFVYCRSGMRSLNAARILEKMDYKIVYNLEGGINAWKKANKPISKKRDKGNY